MTRRRSIERAAKAIAYMVPLDCVDAEKILSGVFTGGWTEQGLREVKWPKDFDPAERKLVRAIARKALNA